MEGKIYTWVGSNKTILLSVNPFQNLPLYSPEQISLHANPPPNRPLPPHVYDIAFSAFQEMALEGTDQSILISGESGAGKTEATKQCLGFIAEVGVLIGMKQRWLDPILRWSRKSCKQTLFWKRSEMRRQCGITTPRDSESGLRFISAIRIVSAVLQSNAIYWRKVEWWTSNEASETSIFSISCCPLLTSAVPTISLRHRIIDISLQETVFKSMAWMTVRTSWRF